MRAGLPTSFWPFAVRHSRFAQNIAAISGNPKTAPYYLRFGESFNGYSIPFGVQVRFKSSERLAKKLPKFGGATIPGIFLAYESKFGCRWNGGYVLVPKVALESWKKGNRLEPGVVREVVRNPRNPELVFPCRSLFPYHFN